MSKMEEFRIATARLESKNISDKTDYRKKDNALDYMSNMNNWLCIHATKYMPLKRNKEDGFYIPTTGMVTDYTECPRNTVHFTLNHIVRSHAYGNWDTTPYIIMAPYKSVTKLNQNPAEVSATDTYWSVDTDKGLLLPQDSYVVKPDNKILYYVGDNYATYKTDNFTDDEILQIESMLSAQDKKIYEKYKNADFEEYEIKQILEYSPDVVKKAYASSKDKKAFLRGMYAEAKFELLTKYLRDAVVRLSMEKMGYNYVDCYDCCERSQVIARTATENGLLGNISNKGHSNSIYGEMESVYNKLSDLFDWYGLYKQKNCDGLYGVISRVCGYPYAGVVLDSIISNKPIDFYALYARAFETAAIDIFCKETAPKTVAQFDKNLDKVLHKSSEKLAKKHNDWLKQVSGWPGYQDFVVKLKKLVALSQTKNTEKGR